jgi:hypothetical protein
MTEAEEAELKARVLRADAKLRERQAVWETPRNIAILAASIAAIAGVLGFKLGQMPSPPQTINVHLDAPLPAKAP